jgi:hypothetical protein
MAPRLTTTNLLMGGHPYQLLLDENYPPSGVSLRPRGKTRSRPRSFTVGRGLEFIQTQLPMRWTLDHAERDLPSVVCLVTAAR